MLSINPSDVIGLLGNAAPALVVFVVVLVAAIIAQIVAHWQPRRRRKMIRSQAFIAVILSLLLAVNQILYGPLSTVLADVTATVTSPSDSTTAQALELGEEVADEGIVMLKDDEGSLPLGSGTKVNVFGWASTHPIYAGTGSGSMNANYETVSLLKGLNDAGIETNQELSDFYTSYCDVRPQPPAPTGLGGEWTLPEPPTSTYSDQLLADAKSYSDTAMIVLGRTGGEGSDLPTDMSTATYANNSDAYADFPAGKTYLDLSQTEQDMIDLVCSNFSNVIVVYNGANAMNLSFINQHPQIKATLWVPGAGQNGFESLGHVVSGEANPSGKTTDTFLYDLKASPSFNNFGNFTYDNTSDITGGYGEASFVNYDEGIYVGYRYFETAADEGVIDYGSTVQYPFGYGLSYTSFSQQMGDLSTDADGNITFDVTVTNTGSVAGKDVVETYVNPPYTDGGIEKASANLVAFDKTELLQPGQSQTVSVSIAPEDLASYDSSADGGTGAYVLESGDYALSINSDSHTVIDQRTYHVDSTITYDAGNKRTSDATAAENLFSDAAGTVTYLSRAGHFANLAEATAAPSSTSMTDEQKALFVCTATYDAAADDDSSATMPTTGARNGVILANLRGLSYDDPQWDGLLDELSVDDMTDLISWCGYQTPGLESVSKVTTSDCDGPTAINQDFKSVGSIGLPPSVTLACTWNADLAHAYGDMMGRLATEMGVSGWYAPAMNIHRSAFGGRNFEYYSEDGLLAGTLAAQVEKGAGENGVYGYIKHFALNEQETNRSNFLCTYANEQSMREIYLKPFELAVKDGDAGAVMTAESYVGEQWAGGNGALLNGLLRGEWGFDGFVITDMFGAGSYMNADQMVRAGGDAALATIGFGTNSVENRSASGVQAMRKAAHHILYTVVNSNAYAEGAPNVVAPAWKGMAMAATVAVLVVLAGLEALTIVRYRRRVASGETDETVKAERRAKREASRTKKRG